MTISKTVLSLVLLLFVGTVFGQKIADPITQIAFKGSVWQIAVSETAGDNDWARNSGIADRLSLTLIESKDQLDQYASIGKEQLKDLKTKPILDIPFLSCGIGHDYYKLIQSEETYLIFQLVDSDFGRESRVVVLNKVS